LWDVVSSTNERLDFRPFYRWYQSEFKQLGLFGSENREKLSIYT